MNYWLILIPLITAFVAWFTPWLTLKLLFHPRKPIRIAGITIHGIFPKHQDQVAEQLGHIVSTQFFSFASIEQKISDPAAFEKVMPLVEDHVDDFLRNKLKEQMPMIGMFIGDKTIGSLKSVFMKEIGALFPEVMKKFAGTMKNEFDVEQIVISKIKNLPATQLEEKLLHGLKKELRLAGLIAALIGLFLGLLQLAIVLWTR